MLRGWLPARGQNAVDQRGAGDAHFRRLHCRRTAHVDRLGLGRRGGTTGRGRAEGGRERERERWRCGGERKIWSRDARSREGSGQEGRGSSAIEEMWNCIPPSLYFRLLARNSEEGINIRLLPTDKDASHVETKHFECFPKACE